MPYNPGVQDISGQIRAQGMMQGSGILSKGVNSIVQDWTKRQEDDKQAMAAVKGTAQFLKTNSQLLGVDPATVDELTTQKPNENALQWHNRMGAFMTMAIQKPVIQKAQQEIERSKAETDFHKIQSANAISELAAQRKDQEAIAAAMPFLDDPTLFTQEVVRRGGRMDAIAKNPFITKVLNAAPRAEIKPVTIRGVDEKGNPTEQTVDAFTQKPLGPQSPLSTPKYVLTPEEQGQAELHKSMASRSVESSQKLLDEVATAAETAQANLRRFKGIEDLYAQGETTGWAQGTLNDITSAAVRAGLYPRDKQASKEQLQQLLATDALTKSREYFTGQGAVSDPERKRIDKVAMDVGKTPEANMAALRMAKALQTRAIAMEETRRAMHDAGKNSVEIAEALRRFRVDNPLPWFEDAPPETNQSGFRLPPGVKIVK